MTSPPRYACALQRDFALRVAEDLFLAFHRPSGRTHVLAPDIVGVMEVMSDTPLSVAEITTRIMAEREIEADEGSDPCDIITARLDELTDLGLVDRT